MPDPEKEHAVAEMLLALMPAGVPAEKLRPGNPAVGEPDIIGTTATGIEVGFEVTEVIDPNLARGDPEANALAAEMRAVFDRVTRTASGEHLPQGIIVFVTFETLPNNEPRRPAKRWEKRLLVVPVVEGVLDHKRGFSGGFQVSVSTRKLTVVATVEVALIRGAARIFDCSEAMAIDIPILATVEKKLSKTYASGVPIHLVIFFELSPYFDIDHWCQEVRHLIRNEPGARRFAGVHLLDYRKRRLLFSELLLPTT